jgi:hypothetical protein
LLTSDPSACRHSDRRRRLDRARAALSQAHRQGDETLTSSKSALTPIFSGGEALAQ